MRQDGKPVERLWFVMRANQIFNEKNPDYEFRFSNYWFEQFQNWYNVSLRRKIHCSQRAKSDLEPVAKKFHSCHSRLRSSSDYQDGDLANMEQKPLPFVLDDGKTYDIKDVKDV